MHTLSKSNLNMHSDEEILSFMDILDLDEDVIDLRTKNLMERSTFTTRHLSNLIHLLQYKQLINVRESSECENEAEYHFIGKLISTVNDVNIDVVCRIVNLVLTLNPSSIIFKSEHLIQQILPEMHLPSYRNVISDSETESFKKTYLQLKICRSVLDAVVKNGTKLTLPFLSTPLEYIIYSKDEKLLTYFLTIIVPQFFTSVEGYDLVDRIWSLLKESKEEKGIISLRILCCLSNYYLPVTHSGNGSIESNIILQHEFWDFILIGLSSDDAFVRKQSIYLAKRAIDYLIKCKKSVNISSKSMFYWDEKNKITLKKSWDNYFILLDSLEEKQSNIVLPSLKLFESVTDIGQCWLKCAFNIGLKHDNTQVRLKSLNYHLQYGIHDKSEAVTVLEAINDITLFDHIYEYKSITDKLNNLLKDTATLIIILEAALTVKWSPVPVYYLTKIMCNFDGSLSISEQTVVIDLLSSLSRTPCNNKIIRKSVRINISSFISNYCKDLNWRKYITIYSCLQLEMTKSGNLVPSNPFKTFLGKYLVISEEDINIFLESTLLSHTNVDFALLYFEDCEDYKFIKLINGIMQKIDDTSKRQYSDKLECLNNAIFVSYLYNKSLYKPGKVYEKINEGTTKNLKILLQYILSMLASDIKFDIEKITFLFKNLDSVVAEINIFNEKEILLQLYKSSLLILQDNITVIDKKILSVFILSNILKCPVMKKSYEQELIDLRTFIEIVLNVKFIGNDNKENSGRLRNTFYEKSCEIVNILLHKDNNKSNILDFIEIAIESGGYGCLKWILKIVNNILPKLLDSKDITFDVIQFLDRMWKEIEELKSNSQYPLCMKEFVNIITQDSLLKKSIYNNIILLYCSKIIEYAAVKNMPLYFLVNRLNEISIAQYSHMVYVLSEILLYPLTLRKDNRIVENVLLEILQEPIYGVDKQSIYFNSHIQFLTVTVVSKISEPAVLNTLMTFMIRKIEELFKNKQRYHCNSHLQKTLQACVQNLLFITLKCRNVDIHGTAMWCMEFLGRLPHQPFERMCLEWYIALYFYLKESILNDEILNQLKSKNVPLTSQFTIMYWIVRHKLKVGTCLSQEFEFLMEFLLSHIMGPIFSIRLQAQYLSTKIYEANDLSDNKLENSKYVYMIQVINKTLEEAAKSEDRSYKKLIKDYFMGSFDIVEDLVPCGIYWVLPRLANALNNDIVEDDFLRDIINKIEDCLNLDEQDQFENEWKVCRRKTTDLLHLKAYEQIVEKDVGNLDDAGTIQKKYVPWKNMSDVNIFDIENKTNKSELIVVASLIDKLPNLGGMARTSEVFGVQTYVVDSLRHLQDKQFQGLSVSAERWVTVEEVRPGQPLKDYLMMKRTEGYSVIAAEQTSTSTKLQSFKFPMKTLLLLGNEKEGVPCDLLPLMDYCVEIPQQGVIRSLNVHVTAAIFIWEYARQNML